MEERLCTCGAVQTERHVVEDCSITQDVRQIYGQGALEDLYDRKFSNEDFCKFIHRILNLYNLENFSVCYFVKVLFLFVFYGVLVFQGCY